MKNNGTEARTLIFLLIWKTDSTITVANINKHMNNYALIYNTNLVFLIQTLRAKQEANKQLQKLRLQAIMATTVVISSKEK